MVAAHLALLVIAAVIKLHNGLGALGTAGGCCPRRWARLLWRLLGELPDQRQRVSSKIDNCSTIYNLQNCRDTVRALMELGLQIDAAVDGSWRSAVEAEVPSLDSSQP